MEQNRGSIAFFTTYRPPVPMDIYSCPISVKSEQDEIHLTDRESYNYNAQYIPPTALKAILKRPKLLASEANEADVDSGRVWGMVFVSERTDNLETLHIAIRFEDDPPKVKVFNFADVYDTFKGVRMEDSGCIAGEYLIYVSTMQPTEERRQPWTAVYKTNLNTGKTDRITPEGEAHLSPSVSPSGKKIAVASLEDKCGWDGERENLKTNIFVLNVERPFRKKRFIRDAGWPTWGSDDVLFFHRKAEGNWGVFRADISNGHINDGVRVTPIDIVAVTPAAIDANRVAVATIRPESKFAGERGEAQYRHIEIFDSSKVEETPIKLTQNIKSQANHFNPFVIVDKIKGGNRIGYHSYKSEFQKVDKGIPKQFSTVVSPMKDVGLFRISGAFPTFSKDGSKLAFVDNEFKVVWVADNKGLHRVYEAEEGNGVFSPAWNQNPDKDILYVCMGPSFRADANVDIYAVHVASSRPQLAKQLTKGYNNAFPSTNSEGTRLVFRSTRDGGGKDKKNLYIMEDADSGDYDGKKITRLTEGNCIDTHCKWSPNGDWIVFSSNRDKTDYRRDEDLDHNRDKDLDSGYFAVYLVNANKPLSVPIRVVASGFDIAGHVNHPFFCPDGKSIVVTSDLAAISVDPISLPIFLHSARPYGDIFTIDIDPNDINKNKNLMKFNRITHSRFENSTGTWTLFSTQDPNAAWNALLEQHGHVATSPCPYATSTGRNPGGDPMARPADYLISHLKKMTIVFVVLFSCAQFIPYPSTVLVSIIFILIARAAAAE